jgi:hypothetical protein
VWAPGCAALVTALGCLFVPGAAAAPRVTAAAVAPVCPGGTVWLGFSGPPGDLTASTPAVQNWTALTAAAGGPATLPVHLYLRYVPPTAVPGSPAAQMESSMESQVRDLGSRGYPVLVTVRSFALGATTSPKPADYATFLRGLVDRIGPWTEAIEVVNEGNVLVGGASTDGGETSYDGDIRADIGHYIVQGVDAAKAEAIAKGYPIKVGFNWGFDYHLPDTPVESGPTFWKKIKEDADPAFYRSVDFLGLHAYPNFISLTTPVYGTSTGATDAVDTARRELAAAGLPQSVAIRVTEIGYATSDTGLLVSYDQANQQTYWSLVLVAMQSRAVADGISSVYAFEYQQDPATTTVGVGDFGIVYPQSATKAVGKTSVSIGGTPKPAYALFVGALEANDRAPGCAFRG